MYEKITLDMLTRDGVSVKTQQYIQSGGVEYAMGSPSRRSFVNSERGRADVAKAFDEQYITAIMAMWGESPTVTEQEI